MHSFDFMGHEIVMGSEHTQNFGQFSETLLSSVPSFKDKKVLDMGCGRGIVGLHAMKSGASHVIFNDILESYVDISRANYEMNDKLCDARFIHGCFSGIDKNILSDIDIIVTNPPQLPSWMMKEQYMNSPVETFKHGGDDGFDIIKLLLGSLSKAKIGKAKIYITLSPVLNEDEFISLFKSNGFSGKKVLTGDIFTPEEDKSSDERVLDLLGDNPQVKIYELVQNNKY